MYALLAFSWSLALTHATKIGEKTFFPHVMSLIMSARNGYAEFCWIGFRLLFTISHQMITNWQDVSLTPLNIASMFTSMYFEGVEQTESWTRNSIIRKTSLNKCVSLTILDLIISNKLIISRKKKLKTGCLWLKVVKFKQCFGLLCFSLIQLIRMWTQIDEITEE